MTQRTTMRHYLVDGYNVIHRDPRLSRVVEQKGLAASRQVLRADVERFARRTGSLVRLIFDGKSDPMSHVESFMNEWVVVSFTSPGEEADERLIAVAMESRRGGVAPVVVSDDRVGVCEPLRAEAFGLMTTADFVKRLKHDTPVEKSADSALTPADKLDIEAKLLARDDKALRAKQEEVPRQRPPQAKATTQSPMRKTRRPPIPVRARKTLSPQEPENSPDERSKTSALSRAERVEIEAHFLRLEAERGHDQDSEVSE